MAQLDEAACQPHHHALGAAVTLHRQATMSVERDVHAGAMYGLIFPDAKAGGE
jgi:hypothetical protein